MRFSQERHIYTVNNRITEHLRFDEALYPPTLKQPQHTHLYSSFSFISTGTYLEKFGRKTYSRKSATVVFHPPYESHAVDFESNARILSVAFSFEKLDRIREQTLILDSPSSCRNQTISWLGGRLIDELRRADMASNLAVEGLVLEMLAEASRSKISSEKSLPPWLKEAKDFLHDNFAGSFVLDEIACLAGVHPAHLSRVFRQKFGCTVGEYVRRLRIEYASCELLKTEKPLSEIALAAGFADQSHFNKIFKDHFNQTPYQYRKAFRSR